MSFHLRLKPATYHGTIYHKTTKRADPDTSTRSCFSLSPVKVVPIEIASPPRVVTNLVPVARDDKLDPLIQFRRSADQSEVETVY